MKKSTLSYLTIKKPNVSVEHMSDILTTFFSDQKEELDLRNSPASHPKLFYKLLIFEILADAVYL